MSSSSQIEKKTEILHKMETENSSLTQQLNDKSNLMERLQTEILKLTAELEKKKKEVFKIFFNPHYLSAMMFLCMLFNV